MGNFVQPRRGAVSSEQETTRTALTSIAEQAETSGVSYFAQIPGRQRRKLMAIRYAIPKRSIFNLNWTVPRPRSEACRAKGYTMQVPSILKGESPKRLLQGAVVGAIATIVVGVNWGGWSLGSTADKMAREQSKLAVIAALAPVCADKFRAQPDAAAKTIALSKVYPWKRAEEFPKEFVTLPGETDPSSGLVDACYALLLAPKSAALEVR